MLPSARLSPVDFASVSNRRMQPWVLLLRQKLPVSFYLETSALCFGGPSPSTPPLQSPGSTQGHRLTPTTFVVPTNMGRRRPHARPLCGHVSKQGTSNVLGRVALCPAQLPGTGRPPLPPASLQPPWRVAGNPRARCLPPSTTSPSRPRAELRLASAGDW